MIADATTEAATTASQDSDLQPEAFPFRAPRLWRARQTTPITEARHLQRVIFSRANDPKIEGVALSALARAWCSLQDSIRIMRGIPLPGQLRPDLQPMKGARVKRGKGSPMLDLPAAAQSFMESAAAKGEQLDDDQVREVNTSESKTPKPPTPAPKRRPEASR